MNALSSEGDACDALSVIEGSGMGRCLQHWMLLATASMSWLFLINDFIAAKKLGQRQDCFPYWQDSCIRFFRHLLTGMAQYVSKLGSSVRTAPLHPTTAACACLGGNDARCITKIKRPNKREELRRGKVTKEAASDDESVQACGTCCSAFWWISGCHCGGPTGKHNYNSLISSILSVPLRPKEAQRRYGFVTHLLPQVTAPAQAALPSPTSSPPPLIVDKIKGNDSWN